MQVQAEQEQMHGADGDMGEEMAAGEEEYELGGMTEAEYLRLVAEQQRLAEQGEDVGDDDDDEGLTEEQIDQLREAFDACDGDKDGALTKDEL